jgi:hypothetical protein
MRNKLATALVLVVVTVILTSCYSSRKNTRNGCPMATSASSGKFKV